MKLTILIGFCIVYRPIFKLTHQRSRLIYNAYKTQQINKQCYDYAVTMKYVDTLLVAKWKKQGFEYLCCMQCIATNNTNFNTTCICRVPKQSLDITDTTVSNETSKIVQCKNCGCTGCASSDVK